MTLELADQIALKSLIERGSLKIPRQITSGRAWSLVEKGVARFADKERKTIIPIDNSVSEARDEE